MVARASRAGSAGFQPARGRSPGVNLYCDRFFPSRQAALARLELGQGNLGEARRLASEAADELWEANETELAILAEILELRTLLASESLDSAAQEIHNRIRIQTTRRHRRPFSCTPRSRGR